MEKLDLAYFDFYQGMVTILIMVLGTLLCLSLARNKDDIRLIAILFLWHTFFSIFYWYYSLSNTADATLYYTKTFYLTPDFKPGTRFTETVSYFITKTLDSNYLNTTLVSNLFGTLGLIFLYFSIRKLLVKINSMWLLILFIPSMSFWSAGLGKDSISFMATCLFLYGITESKNSSFTLSFAFLTMFMVRPHIAAVMLFSFVIYFISKSKTHIVLKALLIPIISVGVVITLQFVQQYVGLNDASLESLDQYVDKRQSYNRGGGSSLDISSMSYPMQMFTYVFRPLPFEAHSIVALITSIENTFLLLLFLFISFKSKFNLRVLLENKNLWLFTYAFLTCTILAITTANLGIATRQKWMFMPVLLYLLIYAYHDYTVNKTRGYV